MQMREADILKYKHFHAYVSKELGRVPSAYKTTYNSFILICCSGARTSRVDPQGVKAKADQALSWSNRPVVLIEPIKENGVTDGKTRKITVNSDNIAKYEAECVARAKGQKVGKSYYFLIQYLLLHELVHWVRFESGLPLDVIEAVDSRHGGRDKAQGKERKTRLAEIDLGHTVIGKSKATTGTVTMEAGDAFENLAYGRDLSNAWASGLPLDWKPK